MSDEIRVEIEGLEELQAALRRLPLGLMNQLLEKAYRPQADRLHTAIVAAAPRRTGKLRRGIVSFQTTVAGEVAIHVVANRRRSRGPVAPHAHLVEGGTRPHGRHPGTRAMPFFLPTAESMKPEMLREIVAYIEAELARRFER